jgi:hypothetical protein
MRFVVEGARFLLFLIAALVPAMPALAQGPDAASGEPQEPGSVIIFPKFEKGTVAVDAVTTALTEINVGVRCPREATCPEPEQVRITFRWVCPGSPDTTAMYVCKETGFDLVVSVGGKVTFNPENLALPGNTRVPAAPCLRGYLIGWVTDEAHQPIKYDGLIGDAVLRDGSTAILSYQAIQIRAEPNQATRAGITPGVDPRTGGPTLVFDGGAGHYQPVGGQVLADVKSHNETYPVSFRNASLIMLTLDVRSNRPNYPTFVSLNYYNEAEIQASASWNFFCWAQVRPADADFRLSGMRTRNGVAMSGQAVKSPFGMVSDIPGPVTLLGLVQTSDGPAQASLDRAYIFNSLDKGNPIPTVFLPLN